MTTDIRFKAESSADKETEQAMAELKSRLRAIHDLQSASYVLEWDQATYMPAGGASARGRQLATLRQLSHEKFTEARVGQLLDQLTSYAESLPADSDDAALVRVTRRQYERSIKVPASFTAEVVEHTSDSFSAWTTARPDNDFARMKPYLEKTLDLSRRYADFFPGYEHPADPHIDGSDFGMKAASVRDVFTQLRDRLVPLVRSITDQEPVDNSCLHQQYDETKQWEYGMEIAQQFGFDLNHGRQDKTHHPFAVPFSISDVRITTRFDENDLSDGLFSTLHETGHALYELGCDPALEATPLAGGTSAGVHESQSRLWENQVGRSRNFWQHYYPQIQSIFPVQLANVPLDQFYRAINKVERSLIRTDADEVTYNLHVIIRFDLELALLEGALSIDELPDAWHARYESDLGVRAPDDSDGVLQDVHWYAGYIGGAFQGYTLGNIMSSQFFEAALQAHPEIPSEIAQGKFDTLHHWLRKEIYRPGSKFTTSELLQKVTGSDLNMEPYMTYLQSKYGEMYDL